MLWCLFTAYVIIFFFSLWKHHFLVAEGKFSQEKEWTQQKWFGLDQCWAIWDNRDINRTKIRSFWHLINTSTPTHLPLNRSSFSLIRRLKPTPVIVSPWPLWIHKQPTDFTSFRCRKWLAVGPRIKETKQEWEVRRKLKRRREPPKQQQRWGTFVFTSQTRQMNRLSCIFPRRSAFTPTNTWVGCWPEPLISRQESEGVLCAPYSVLASASFNQGVDSGQDRQTFPAGFKGKADATVSRTFYS